MKSAPVVAELGRPETAEETAARKAEFSRVYRASQTFRNLIAALLITVAVVALIVFAVPRGTPVPAPPIDLSALAAETEGALQRPVIVPEVGDGWKARSAQVAGGTATTWTVSLYPTGEDERGFLTLSQAFDADRTWAAVPLRGAQSTETTTIDGIDWDVFTIAKPEAAANISYALGAQAGSDYLLLYGARSPAETAAFAATLTAQIRELSR